MKILSTFLLCFSFAFSLFGKDELITLTLIDPIQEIYLYEVEVHSSDKHIYIGTTDKDGNIILSQDDIEDDLIFSKKGYKDRLYTVSKLNHSMEISLEMTTEQNVIYIDSKKFIPTDSLNDVMSFVDEEALFQDPSAKSIQVFIQNNLNYPMYAIEHNLKGKVYLKFVIEVDGSITNIQVVKGASPCLDREAVRCISKMPNWTPGKVNGKIVRSYFQLPINYALE